MKKIFFSILLVVIIIFCSAWSQNDKFVSKREHVSTFCTSFATSSEGRKHNIKLATSNFSWIVVKPYEELSFNGIVGLRREENGYKNALVISYGEYVEGVGGGVCQVSSTLYNAWIRAGLDVKVVKNHTIPASYVELSQDATVSDTQDLVLYNNHSQSVVINGKIEDDKIIFDIFATKPEYEIRVISKVIKTITPNPPEEEIVYNHNDQKIYYDKDYPYIILKKERKGYHSCAFIQYLKDEKIVYEKKIREDYYLPMQGKIGLLAKEELTSSQLIK